MSEIVNKTVKGELPSGGAVEVRLVGPKVVGGRTPALAFEVSMLNAQDNRVYTFGGCPARWDFFRTPDGSSYATGSDDTAILWGAEHTTPEYPLSNRSAMVFEVAFPLPQEAALTIDALRNPTFGFYTKLEIAPIIVPVAPEVAGGPVRVSEAIRVRADDWRELSPGLGLQKRRIFELQAGSFRGVESFEQALRALDHARDLIAADKSGKAIAECRNVVEGVLEPLGYSVKGTFLYDRLAKAGLPEAWLAMLRAFKDVVNPEHHRDEYEWHRAEAEAALQTALMLGQYLAHLPGYDAVKAKT